MKLSFLGGAETVTGSRYLLETARGRVLLDCGLFQGLKKLRLQNWRAFPIEPASIDAVLLTHAHIDHSGYLPRLCREGFSGPVYVTGGTRDLLKILLPDCGFLQEEEARHANKWGYSKHTPAEPLYTRDDAERCLEQLVTVPFHQRFEPVGGMAVVFTRAGHILGSASIALQHEGLALAFSGDVGRPNDVLMRAPEPLVSADILVVESTYGDRRHPENQVSNRLERIVNQAVARGGVVLVPAFAVGRAQHVLHVLAELLAAGRVPSLPVFLDSPMAITATRCFAGTTTNTSSGERSSRDCSNALARRRRRRIPRP